jgi:peroxiredoxin Q/BCP
VRAQATRALNQVGYRAPVWFCPEAGEKGVVFFLYPKAATPGCTTQACLYRDAKQAFGEQGYDIYGLVRSRHVCRLLGSRGAEPPHVAGRPQSKDKPAAQAKWIESKSLSYSLLSDPSSELIKALGAFAAPAS